MIISSILYLAALGGSFIGISYFSLSILGLGLSYLALSEKQGNKTIASKFCNIDQRLDCQSALQSNQGSIFNLISLSDLSFIYFGFISIAYLFDQNSTLFLIFTVCSAPVILYTILIQAFSLRKWCLLCLSIAFILVLQLLGLILISGTLNFESQDTVTFLLALSLGTMSWKVCNSLITEAGNREKFEIESLAFRRNHYLYLPYYKSQEIINTYREDLLEIRLGTASPNVILTLVTNPLCVKCFSVHQIYTGLLQKYPELQINIRFYVLEKEDHDFPMQLSARFLEIYFENGEETFRLASKEYYQNPDPLKWLKKWENCSDPKYQSNLSIHKDWCEESGTYNTPTLLINGKKFPEFYHIKDLANLIEKVIEEEKNKNIYA